MKMPPTSKKASAAPASVVNVETPGASSSSLPSQPRRRMTTAQSAQIQALTQLPEDQGGRKRRRKKNQADSPSRGDGDKAKADPHAARPGKKRLRKLRYLKKNSTRFDFLRTCAENAQFTGSVRIVGGNDTAGTTATASQQTSVASVDETAPTTTTTVPKVHLRTSCTSQADWGSCQTDTPSITCIQIQPLLVLDLNGILCHRIRSPPQDARRYFRPPITRVAGTPIVPRPDLVDILTRLDSHFCLAVWTSAKSKTARKLVAALFPPAIAARLLFVWAQHDCDSAVETAIAEEVAESEKCFEKDLGKVWKEFPLWNASNTLLVDDSPDKCVAWSQNALHPPPINGLAVEGAASSTNDKHYDKHSAIGNDEENVRLQHCFFNELVQNWNDRPMEQLWQAEDGDEATETSNAGGLGEFLKVHAVGHMGW